MAASATLALKAGVWFRRGRLFIVSPDSLAQRARCQAETPLIVLFRFLRPALKLKDDAHRKVLLRSVVVVAQRGLGAAPDGVAECAPNVLTFPSR
jgi:hypothetical protein